MQPRPAQDVNGHKRMLTLTGSLIPVSRPIVSNKNIRICPGIDTCLDQALHYWCWQSVAASVRKRGPALGIAACSFQ